MPSRERTSPSADRSACVAGVDLYWLPLGAGGRVVRWNGRLYEAVAARLQRRPVTDLFHAALEVCLPEGRWTVEMAPEWTGAADVDHGVVARGAVGARWAGRSRWFRYEVRRWHGGSIADVAEAVASPLRLTSDESTSRRLLSLLPDVPTPVWGRDDLETDEMWNSNSVVAWALARSGLDASGVRVPDGGTAPGWGAGVVVAAREAASAAARSAPSP